MPEREQTSSGPHCATCHCKPHRRVGPGECACGFSAYRLSEFVWDYGDRLNQHIRAATRRPVVAAVSGTTPEDPNE